MTGQSNLLRDLARAKALFQQRAATAALGIWPAGSKPDQNVDSSAAPSTPVDNKIGADPVGKEG